MKLTTFSDYTLRVLMYLATHPGRLITIAEVAQRYAISENHLMKVVHHLARSGVVESVRGKGGGLRLAVAASAIRLGDVVRASEGGAPIVECMDAASNTCRITPGCRLASVLMEAFAALYTTLDRYTLADITRNADELNQLLDCGG